MTRRDGHNRIKAAKTLVNSIGIFWVPRFQLNLLRIDINIVPGRVPVRFRKRRLHPSVPMALPEHINHEVDRLSCKLPKHKMYQ
ncbi:MAG: hypothetical protein ACE5JB_13485 [bacterium]